MSAYPPPPPPPAGGPYPPADPQFARAQQRAQQQAIRAQQRAQQQAMKAQFRAQQAAMRLQRRALRRTSIVGPVILLALGTVLLLVSLGRLSWVQSLEWFGRWWPAVLIFAGVVLLVEWALDQRSTDERAGSRTLGGGVVALLIFLAFFGVASHVAARGLAWKNANFGDGFGDGFGDTFGNRNDTYDDLSSPIAAGAALVIHDPHGDVTVTGSSTDGLVHVNVHTQTYAWNERDIQRKVQALRPVFSASGKDMDLTVGYASGGQSDLTVAVPAGTPVTVNADHGDINISELHSAVSLSANHGDVTASEIQGDIQATVNDDDASVKFSEIKGSLNVNGHTGDVDITELTGPLTMHGDFYGTTHLQHITGNLQFDSSRTHFAAVRLDDEFSVEKDSLDASGLLGPVVLKTSSKNITLDRVQGNVDVTNSNGDVNVTNAAPSATISIQNRHGSVDLGLPASASFVLDAQTRNGDMENDFGLSTQGDGDNHTLRGTVGSHGGKITLATSDGDVTVRKSSVAPLPPAPPAPPASPASSGAAPKAAKSYTF
jgi:DUF4097 and DUF4098 domain-containing protein YvlB